MFYVYLLKSINNPDKIYIGYTKDLAQRLSDHNSGQSPHTSKYIPWTLEQYSSFKEHSKALAFEKYLKTASGRAFAKKHFW
jgi:predicted GIY-YIG superfamily endonuclease